MEICQSWISLENNFFSKETNSNCFSDTIYFNERSLIKALFTQYSRMSLLANCYFFVLSWFTRIGIIQVCAGNIANKLDQECQFKYASNYKVIVLHDIGLALITHSVFFEMFVQVVDCWCIDEVFYVRTCASLS